MAENARLRQEANAAAHQAPIAEPPRKLDWGQGVRTLLAVTGLVSGALTIARLVWPG